MHVIVKPKIYDVYRNLIQSTCLLTFEGIVQHEIGVVNLLVNRAASFPESSELELQQRQLLPCLLTDNVRR